jgi:hypothetical protein
MWEQSSVPLKYVIQNSSSFGHCLNWGAVTSQNFYSRGKVCHVELIDQELPNAPRKRCLAYQALMVTSRVSHNRQTRIDAQAHACSPLQMAGECADGSPTVPRIGDPVLVMSRVGPRLMKTTSGTSHHRRNGSAARTTLKNFSLTHDNVRLPKESAFASERGTSSTGLRDQHYEKRKAHRNMPVASKPVVPQNDNVAHALAGAGGGVLSMILTYDQAHLIDQAVHSATEVG